MDAMLQRLASIKAALSDHSTWSLKPLADECQALIAWPKADTQSAAGIAFSFTF